MKPIRPGDIVPEVSIPIPVSPDDPLIIKVGKYTYRFKGTTLISIESDEPNITRNWIPYMSVADKWPTTRVTDIDYTIVDEADKPMETKGRYNKAVEPEQLDKEDDELPF